MAARPCHPVSVDQYRARSELERHTLLGAVGAQRARDHPRNKGDHSLPSTNYSCTMPNRSSNPAIMRAVPNAIRYHSDTRRSFPE